MADKQFGNSIYKLSPKEIILDIVLPYELMNEVEQLKLGRYYDGVRSEWVWNEDEVNKCPDETLWRLIAISNTVWMEQQERIKSIYEEAFPNFEWWNYRR